MDGDDDGGEMKKGELQVRTKRSSLNTFSVPPELSSLPLMRSEMQPTV